MGKFRFSEEGEAALTDWMAERSNVAYLSCASAEQTEEFLIKVFQPPLNISFRKTPPLSKDLMRRSRIFRRASARLDRVPVHIGDNSKAGNTILWVKEKIAKRTSERVSDLGENRNGRVALGSLDLSERPEVDIGFCGQAYLRQPLRFSNPSNISSYDALPMPNRTLVSMSH